MYYHVCTCGGTVYISVSAPCKSDQQMSLCLVGLFHCSFVLFFKNYIAWSCCYLEVIGVCIVEAFIYKQVKQHYIQVIGWTTELYRNKLGL